MKKYKVLHISPSGNLYGTERHILSILKYADKEKFEHYVATPTYGYFNEKLKENGIKYFMAGRTPYQKNKILWLFRDSNYKKLIKIIKAENFDIIHSHLISYGGFTGRLYSRAKIFHTRHGVFWSEDELSKISVLDKSFQRIKNKIFDITIAIGEYEKNTMIKYLGYNEKKIRLTFNGVNTEEIQGKLDKNLDKMKLFGTDNIVVGAVGRLERQKGFHMYVEAAAKVLSKLKNVTFVLIGEGSLKSQLEDQIRNLGIASNFSIIDYKNNIYDYMNCMDVAVQTSLWEGISYVVLEPMVLSKPVIALSTKNTSGVKEIIVNGKTGYVIFEDYVDTLSQRILELSTDKGKIITMGNASLARVAENFTELRTAKDMERYYEESLNNI